MNDIELFGKLIKDTKFAMMTTMDKDRTTLHSRPMTVQEIDFDGDLWFFASRSSDLARQIENYALVNLTFSNLKDFSFLSAQGFARMVYDREKERALWNPLYMAWFPRGLEDPDLCLIKVMVESADYWVSPESKLVRLAGFAKAIILGKKADESLAEQGHMEFRNK